MNMYNQVTTDNIIEDNLSAKPILKWSEMYDESDEYISDNTYASNNYLKTENDNSNLDTPENEVSDKCEESSTDSESEASKDQKVDSNLREKPAVRKTNINNRPLSKKEKQELQEKEMKDLNQLLLDFGLSKSNSTEEPVELLKDPKMELPIASQSVPKTESVQRKKKKKKKAESIAKFEISEQQSKSAQLSRDQVVQFAKKAISAKKTIKSKPLVNKLLFEEAKKRSEIEKKNKQKKQNFER